MESPDLQALYLVSHYYRRSLAWAKRLPIMELKARFWIIQQEQEYRKEKLG